MRDIDTLYSLCGHKESFRIPSTKTFEEIIPVSKIPGAEKPVFSIKIICQKCSAALDDNSESEALAENPMGILEQQSKNLNVDFVKWTRKSLSMDTNCSSSPILVTHDMLTWWSNFAVDHFPPSQILNFIETFHLAEYPSPRSKSLTAATPSNKASSSSSIPTTHKKSSSIPGLRNAKAKNMRYNRNNDSQIPLHQTLKLALISAKLSRCSWPSTSSSSLSSSSSHVPPNLPSPRLVSPSGPRDASVPIPGTYKTLWRDIQDAYCPSLSNSYTNLNLPRNGLIEEPSPHRYPFTSTPAPYSDRGQETGYQISRGLTTRIAFETAFFEDAAEIFLSSFFVPSSSSSSSPNTSKIRARKKTLDRELRRLEDVVEKTLRDVMRRAAAAEWDTVVEEKRRGWAEEEVLEKWRGRGILIGKGGKGGGSRRGKEGGEKEEDELDGLGKKDLLALGRWLTLVLWEGHRDRRFKLCELIGEIVGREVSV